MRDVQAPLELRSGCLRVGGCDTGASVVSEIIDQVRLMLAMVGGGSTCSITGPRACRPIAYRPFTCRSITYRPTACGPIACRLIAYTIDRLQADRLQAAGHTPIGQSLEGVAAGASGLGWTQAPEAFFMISCHR